MFSHSKEIKIFSANANRPLAEAICSRLGIPMGDSIVTSFADGEVSVSINETVRGCDVFVIQSTCKPVNDNLMELLILIDALRRASASRITAVIPYFGYARQDRKAKARDPISAKLVANLITKAGADRVLTMDLHASQIQGFFDIPVDNLLGNPVFVKYYLSKFSEAERENMVVVSPDVGSVARARTFAQKVGMGLAIVDKRRQKANSCEVMNIIGDVRDKDCHDRHRRFSGQRLHRPTGSGWRQAALRLRQPRRALRSCPGAHREQLLRGGPGSGYHPHARGLYRSEAQAAERGGDVCRGHHPHR